MASIRIIGEKLHGTGMKGVYTAEETLKSGLLSKLLKLLPKLLKKNGHSPKEWPDRADSVTRRKEQSPGEGKKALYGHFPGQAMACVELPYLDRNSSRGHFIGYVAGSPRNPAKIIPVAINKDSGS